MPPVRRLHLALPAQLDEKLEAIKQFYSINSTAAIVMSINFFFEKVTKEKYGFKGSIGGARLENKKSKKEQSEEHLKQMLAMSNEELTQHLIDIGYNDPPKLEGKILIGLKMTTNPDGSRWLATTYTTPGEDKPYSTFGSLSWDNMISDMDKHGKL